MRRLIASTFVSLDWNNTTLLHGDVVSAIITLKTQPGPDLQIIGSGDVIQPLQAASLIVSSEPSEKELARRKNVANERIELRSG